MRTMHRLGERFWDKAQEGFAREIKIFSDPSNSWIFSELDGVFDQTRPFFAQINALGGEGRYLVRYICCVDPAQEQRMNRYMELLDAIVIQAKPEDICGLPIYSKSLPPMAGLIKALEAGYVIGRICGSVLAERCMKLMPSAIDLEMRCDPDVTLSCEQRRTLTYSDVCLATSSILWWLMGGNLALANDLWEKRLQDISPRLQKEDRYYLLKFLVNIIQFTKNRNMKQAAVAEKALIDMQLFWLRCVSLDRTCEIHESELIMAELLFQELTEGRNLSVRDAINHLQLNYVKSRLSVSVLSRQT